MGNDGFFRLVGKCHAQQPSVGAQSPIVDSLNEMIGGKDGAATKDFWREEIKHNHRRKFRKFRLDLD